MKIIQSIIATIMLILMPLQAVETTAKVETNSTATLEEFDRLSVLYFAMFNRMPDSEGLAYWYKKLSDDGWSIEKVSESFFDQNETKVLYPDLYIDNPDRANLITTVYKNLFNRYPDGVGLGYWYQELLLGNITPSLFILAIINGSKDEDRDFIISMLKISKEFEKYGITDQDKFRDVLSILSDDGEELAMNFIGYISHLVDISKIKPTISFKNTPTISDGATLNISSKSQYVEGLNIAIFDDSTKIWKPTGKVVIKSGKVVELNITNVSNDMSIKIRFQNQDQSIATASSSLKVTIKDAVVNLADSDGDGILDRGDHFPNDPNESRDFDGDGIGDNADRCDDTPYGSIIDENGCYPNTPAIITGQLSGTITEGDEPISKTIIVTDPDKGEAVMIAVDIVGDYGKLSLASDGKWTYTMTADLARSVSKNESFRVSSQDGVTANITVIVIGADIVSTTN